MKAIAKFLMYPALAMAGLLWLGIAFDQWADQCAARRHGLLTGWRLAVVEAIGCIHPR